MKLIDNQHILFQRFPNQAGGTYMIAKDAQIIHMEMKGEDVLVLKLREANGSEGEAHIKANDDEGCTILNAILLSERTNGITLEALEQMEGQDIRM